MARYDERRGYKRHDLRAPVIFAYQDSDQFTKVQMYNYCEDGLCFEARNAIEPGSDIYIMMENFAPDAVGAEFYDGYLAEVRWCRELIQEDASDFMVGVKYYQTIIK